jgi:hypothetical protein
MSFVHVQSFLGTERRTIPPCTAYKIDNFDCDSNQRNSACKDVPNNLKDSLWTHCQTQGRKFRIDGIDVETAENVTRRENEANRNVPQKLYVRFDRLRRYSRNIRMLKGKHDLHGLLALKSLVNRTLTVTTFTS